MYIVCAVFVNRHHLRSGCQLGHYQATWLSLIHITIFLLTNRQTLLFVSWDYALVLSCSLSLKILDLSLVIILKLSFGVCEVTAFAVLNYRCYVLVKVGIQDLCEHLIALNWCLRSLNTAVTL